MPAKRTSRKRRYPKGFVAIPVNVSLALAALASDTILSADLLASLVEDLYISSIKGYWSLIGATPTEGPLNMGFAHGDYTVNEIEEKLDANVSDPDDKIAVERSRRLVRSAGIFPVITANEVLHGGIPVSTTMKFVVGDGKAVSFWVYNRSGAVLTTGATIGFIGTVFGRWLR